MNERVRAQLLQLSPTLCNPVDCSPPRLLCPRDSQGKSTGVGLPCPPPEALPDLGITPVSHASPALQANSFNWLFSGEF